MVMTKSITYPSMNNLIVVARCLKRIASLLKEIGDFYRFFFRTPEAEKQIVFYSEHGDYYPYFEGLIDKLIGEHKRTLSYITSDPYDPILNKSESRIKVFYLNKLLALFMAHVSCKVFVMTLTDLNQFQLKRSLNPVHYIYVFHSLVSTHMIYRHGAFDHYDSILCCGPHHVLEIRKLEALEELQQKALVEAGYYRLERIYDAYQKYSIENSQSDANNTVLIASSWGRGNILEHCGERLIHLLLEAGYNVIVRPHPETLRHCPRLVTLLASKFDEDPGFILERSVATDDALLRAGVLISDYSGIAFEYAFGTERPVIFLNVPVKIQNQEFRELGIEPVELALRSEIGVIVSPNELEAIPQIVSDLIRSRAAYKGRIAELRKEYVYEFGHSSETGAQHIIDLEAG